MEPLDCLSNEDKETILEFVSSYGRCQPIDIETILYSWNKNKRTLFKALGKQLRVKIPIDLQLDGQLYFRQLQEIYIQPAILKTPIDNGHAFINQLVEYFNDCYQNIETDGTSIRCLENLFYYSSIEKGKTLQTNTFFKYATDVTLTIPRGTKIIKAIQKVLNFYAFPHMDSFNKWRNDISNLTTSKSIKTNLVFSIHPIDFLTMSDNNCSWNSCMSWMKKGSYSTGTVEMLNSNMAVVCYLESSKNFYFNYHKIPNKSWRCLFYAHKSILLSGKQYPYYNEQVVKSGLDNFSKLLKKNLNWSYQYKNQQYQDLKHYYDNWYVRQELSIDQYRLQVNSLGKERHSILVYTYGMYNDLIEDHDTKYWCCRNYVDHTLKISVSGAATCMHCGKPLDNRHEIRNLMDSELRSHGSDKYCKECEENNWCSICATINSRTKYKIPVNTPRKRKVPITDYVGHKRLSTIQVEDISTIFACADCIKEFLYYAKGDYFIKKDDLAMFEGDRRDLIPAKEVKNLEKYITRYTI